MCSMCSATLTRSGWTGLQSVAAMPVPSFRSDGYLPVGNVFGDVDGQPIYLGHDSSAAEIEARLVNAFPQSLTRPALFREFGYLRRLVLNHLNCVVLIVSGEFVTNRDDPQSLLVVLDVPGKQLDNLDPDSHWLFHRLFDSQEWAITEDADLKVQTGIVRAYPRGHVKFEVGVGEQRLQRYMAGYPTAETHVGGYVQVLECEGGVERLNELIGISSPGDQSP